MSPDHCSWREDNEVWRQMSHHMHATNEVQMFEVVFININHRWQNIETDIFRCGCMSACFPMENREELAKFFHLRAYIGIVWRGIVVMLIFVFTLFTSILNTFAFSRFEAIENNTQLDEPFHLSYSMTMFKRTSVKDNFSTIKMYSVGSLYTH